MDLAAVIAGIEFVNLTGRPNARITAVACDSRKVLADTLFFALPGAKTNGNEFVADALARRAAAIASAQPAPADLPREITWIELPPGTDRKALAVAAANFYGRPADALKLIGVTGTNGKTTITYIIDSILRAAGYTTGRIGTTGYDTPQGFRVATNTTPESIDLQQMFAEVRDAGGTHAVLEVSSHSLVMDRTWGCHFDVAIFTNLTRDHLNFHKTFEEYFAAKKVLFAGTGAGAPGTAVLNIDDPYGARLDALAKRTLTYGISSPADLTAKKFALSKLPRARSQCGLRWSAASTSITFSPPSVPPSPSKFPSRKLKRAFATSNSFPAVFSASTKASRSWSSSITPTPTTPCAT